MELEIDAAAAGSPSELHQLAVFVGRLYLFLVAIVYDHSRWLPRALREDYKAALAEVYPSAHRLQRELLALEEAQADHDFELRQRLRLAGLSGAQLQLKLAHYDHAEARFYGVKVGSDYRPDRRFKGVTEFWQFPESEEEEGAVRVVIDDITEGDKSARLRSLAEQACPPANTLLGTLLSIFSAAESYKEIKEAVEWGLENGKPVIRAFNWVRNRWVAVRGFGRRPQPPAVA